MIMKGVAKVAGEELVKQAAKKTFKSVLARGGIEAAEGGLYEGIKAISENISRDPELSAEAVISAAAKGALFGGAGGALFKTAGIGLTSMGKLGKQLDNVAKETLPKNVLDNTSMKAALQILNISPAKFDNLTPEAQKNLAIMIQDSLLDEVDDLGNVVGKKNLFQTFGTSYDDQMKFFQKVSKKSGEEIGNFEIKANAFLEDPNNYPSTILETRKNAEELFTIRDSKDLKNQVDIYNRNSGDLGYYNLPQINSKDDFFKAVKTSIDQTETSIDQSFDNFNKWKKDADEAQSVLDNWETLKETDPEMKLESLLDETKLNIRKNKLERRVNLYNENKEVFGKELSNEVKYISDVAEKFPGQVDNKLLNKINDFSSKNGIDFTSQTGNYPTSVYETGLESLVRGIDDTNIDLVFSSIDDIAKKEGEIIKKVIANAGDFRKDPGLFENMPSEISKDLKKFIDLVDSGKSLDEIKKVNLPFLDDGSDKLIDDLYNSFNSNYKKPAIDFTGEDFKSKIDSMKNKVSKYVEEEKIIDGKSYKTKKPIQANYTEVNSDFELLLNDLEKAGFPLTGKLDLVDMFNLKRTIDGYVSYARKNGRESSRHLIELRNWVNDKAIDFVKTISKSNPQFEEQVGMTVEQYVKNLQKYGASKDALELATRENTKEKLADSFSFSDKALLFSAFFNPKILLGLGIKKGYEEYGDKAAVYFLTQRPGQAGGLLQAQASQEKVFNTIGKSIKNFVKSTKGAVKDSTPYSMNAIQNFKSGKKEKDRVNDFKNTKKFIENLQQNPEVLQQNLENSFKDLNDINPDLYIQAVSKTSNALSFLASKLPIDPLAARKINPELSKWKPSDLELRKFERYLAAVDDPMSVLDDMNRGIIAPEGVETLKTVYPRIYQEIYDQMMGQLAELQEELPYKQRLQLSIMFGLPTDPSLNPSTLARLQSNFAPGQEQQMRKPSNQQAKINNMQSTSESIIKDNV